MKKYVLDQSKAHAKFFEAICAIPHGSKNEKALSDYLVDFAKKRNLWVFQDEKLNVIIKKPASIGYENSKPVILQGHMDMVCEKNKDSDHDFLNDPLSLYIKDGWLYANGTTLGADDGVAVAYMLALLDDQNAKHPPLECVFTTEEEIGLFGALALDPNLLEGRRFIGMDGGGESKTLISSAGGMRCEIVKQLNFINVPNEIALNISIRGLSGGHSGGMIDKEKGNANQIAFRILYRLLKANLEIQLVSIGGGDKDNAIPREADVSVIVNDIQKAIDLLKVIEKEIQEELAYSDNGFRIETSNQSVNTKLDTLQTKQVIQFLFCLPNGVKNKSMAIENLVISSLNIGKITIDETRLTITYSLRSAIESHLLLMGDSIECLCQIFDANVAFNSKYPGWNYEANSPLRDLFLKTYKELRNEDATLEAVHGGVECGVFKMMFPEMDIVTLGPIAKQIHTPEECLDLASFDRTFEFLQVFLAAMTK